MNMKCMNLVMIPEEELSHLKNSQAEILAQLKNLQSHNNIRSSMGSYITAKEYMTAVKICRSKFDQLVLSSKIKTIKKRRKIYLPSSEVERFFSDPTIQ